MKLAYAVFVSLLVMTMISCSGNNEPGKDSQAAGDGMLKSQTQALDSAKTAAHDADKEAEDKAKAMEKAAQ